MLSGFYSAASGMVNQTIAMNHITDNVTYAQVPGYKKQEYIFKSFDEDLQYEVSKFSPFAKSSEASGIEVIQGITDFSQGSLRHSGETKDLSIEGEGFFEIETPNGRFYTRNGTFRINESFEMLTPSGHNFIGEGNSPVVLEGIGANGVENLIIDDEGNIYAFDNTKIPAKKLSFGKLKLTSFTSMENLERIGEGLWRNNENSAGEISSDAKVRQGYVEMSNTQPVENMVEMILNHRLYESNSNVLKEMHKSISDFIGQIIA